MQTAHRSIASLSTQTSRLRFHTYAILSLLVLLVFQPARAEETGQDNASLKLAQCISPWLEQIAAPKPGSTLAADLTLQIDNKTHELKWDVTYIDADSFLFEAKHPDYEMILARDKARTALILPKHRKIFLSAEQDDSIFSLAEQDHLQPSTLISRSLTSGSLLSLALPVIESKDASNIAGLLPLLGRVKFQPIPSENLSAPNTNAEEDFLEESNAGDSLIVDDHTSLTFRERTLVVRSKSVNGKLALLPPGNSLYESKSAILDSMTADRLEQHWEGSTTEFLPRHELERTIARGIRRAAEVLAPSPALTRPAQRKRETANGRLDWVDGQRVVSLWGSPEEIGKSHGELLRTESMRCLDSVLHAFGTVQTIASGKWFRKELELAYARLEPHIPQRHKTETEALAKAVGVEPQLMQVVNVFPELFHCSGFAVFGDATQGGKLYHGRVLDYMTTIGLQDSATTFVISPTDQQAFVNVGYAGFIGSVSGMNDQKISLGEMGGKGEGQWDGVPMATLMRRALEECKTLEEVKTLWSESPRTCEYYYVFADGKNRTAVGVAATPESIEFVEPGQSHKLLGEGIKDSVILSAGNRLLELRKRVQTDYGKLDAISSQNLMCRPVAMKSNLHNVLFVPEDEILYIANATHSQPAADRPYVKIDLRRWLETIPNYKPNKNHSKTTNTQSPKDAPKQTAREWTASDSIANEINEKESNTTKAQQILRGLTWTSDSFKVNVEIQDQTPLVRFPSPISTHNPINDQVALEWFKAGKSGQSSDHAQKLPAILVVHESGKKMTVGRMIARGLAAQGLHAFMIHLPHYGARLSEHSSKADPSVALRQSVMDVRRALDAIASCPEVDASRISLQGTSLGGFVATTAAGIDDKPHKLFILLAGGDLSSVLKDGKKDAQGFRRKLLAAGLDDDSIDESLDAVEPLHVADRISASKTWLYSGIYDDVVPPRNSDLLAEAIGLDEKHHIKLEANHYTGVLLLPSVLASIAREAIAD